MKATYTKTVTLVKGESRIVAHVSRGNFHKYSSTATIPVDGEFGRMGERCINDWHGDYEQCKRDFLAYIGERVLDGYAVEKVDVCDTTHKV